MAQTDEDRRSTVRTVVVVLVGQVGCLTLAVILAAVYGGLWLDAQFGTKPIITVVLLMAGVPVSILAMLYIARKTVGKIEAQSTLRDRSGH